MSLNVGGGCAFDVVVLTVVANSVVDNNAGQGSLDPEYAGIVGEGHPGLGLRGHYVGKAKQADPQVSVAYILLSFEGVR